jgi:hypothetical protein
LQVNRDVCSEMIEEMYWNGINATMRNRRWFTIKFETPTSSFLSKVLQYILNDTCQMSLQSFHCWHSIVVHEL